MRGGITYTLTVWCRDCPANQAEVTGSIRIAKARWKQKGWVYVKQQGWQCPLCRKAKITHVQSLEYVNHSDPIW